MQLLVLRKFWLNSQCFNMTKTAKTHFVFTLFFFHVSDVPHWFWEPFHLFYHLSKNTCSTHRWLVLTGIFAYLVPFVLFCFWHCELSDAGAEIDLMALVYCESLPWPEGIPETPFCLKTFIFTFIHRWAINVNNHSGPTQLTILIKALSREIFCEKTSQPMFRSMEWGHSCRTSGRGCAMWFLGRLAAWAASCPEAGPSLRNLWFWSAERRTAWSTDLQNQRLHLSARSVSQSVSHNAGIARASWKSCINAAILCSLLKNSWCAVGAGGVDVVCGVCYLILYKHWERCSSHHHHWCLWLEAVNWI